MQISKLQSYLISFTAIKMTIAQYLLSLKDVPPKLLSETHRTERGLIPFIYSLIQQIQIERLHCAGHCSRHLFLFFMAFIIY